MSDLFSKIKEVTELDSIAGYEHSVRDYLRSKITSLVDEVQTDGLGGIFGIKHSDAENAPRIMVAAHMDEVGFMVSDIKADGTLRAVGIGGWNPLVLSSQRFTLYTRDGSAIPVVSGQSHHTSFAVQMALLLFQKSMTSFLMLDLQIKLKPKHLVSFLAISSCQNLKQSLQLTKKMLSQKLGTIALVCLW